MLSFKQFIIEQQLILEDRLDKIKETFKDKINTDHDTNAEHKDSDKIVDHFASYADPTHNKQYTQWIVNRYNQGNFRQEDHPRIRETLANFERYRARLDNKDINRYRSLSDVEDALEPHLGQAASGKEQKKKIKSEGADLIHNDEDLGVTVHHIKNEKAACAYGAGTRWCTAGKENNMFKSYNDKGPIHVIQHNGRKYQFHVASKQFMDEKDDPISFKDIHPDIAKSLAKSDHPEINGLNVIEKNPNFSLMPEKAEKMLKSSTAVRSALANNYSEYAGRLINDEDPRVREIVAKYPEHAEKLVNDPDNFIRRLVAKHPEHAGKLVNDEDPYVRISVAKHSEHAGKLINDADPWVRAAVAQHKDLAGKLINDKHVSVRAAVAQHKDLAGKLINDPDQFVRSAVAQHPEHAEKLINDKDESVRAAVAQHKDLAGKLINDSDSDVRMSVAEHPEHAAKLINDPATDVRSKIAFMHGNLADNFINDPDKEVRMMAAGHPKHAELFLNDPDNEVKQTARLALNM